MMKRQIFYLLGIIVLTICKFSILHAQYDSWKTFTTTDGLVGDFVYAMLEDSQGRLWFGTNKGVSSYDGISWTSYRVLQNCVSTGAKNYDNYISSIAEDDTGALWFGTIGEKRSDGCGVLRFDGVNWTAFTTENSGLAGDQVNAVLADRNGVLWFGTRAGVSRYDGREWTTFDTENSGLIEDDINAIFEDKRGNLWFATDIGVSQFDGHEWKSFDIETDCGIGGSRVSVIFEDSRGVWWFATDFGVCRYDGKEWTNFNPGNSGLIYNYINAINEDDQGALWFATNRGVSRYDGKEWKSFTPDNSGLPGKIVLSVVEDINGTFWFGTKGYGIARYEPELWVTFSDDSIGTYSTEDIDRIVEDKQSALWFLTHEFDDYYDSELIRYDRNRWQNITSENRVFAGRSIHTFIKDSKGTLWFATDSGAASYDGNEWQVLTTSTSGLTNNTVYAILEDSKKALWFATRHGVSRYDGTQWTTLTAQNSGLAGDIVYKILADKQGKLWFLLEDTVAHNIVVSQYDGEKWKTTIIPDDLDEYSVYDLLAVLVDHRGTLWVGTWKGLGKYENDEWTILNEETHTLGHNRVTNIFEDGQGILWVTTDLGGVSRYDGREWKILTTGNSGLVSNRIYSIYEDHRGALWFGGTAFEADRGGLHRLEKEKWLAFTRENSGLVDDDIYLIYEDSGGDFWLAAQRNIIQFRGDTRPPNTAITGGPTGLVGTATSLFAFRGGDNFSRLDDLLFSIAVVDTSREPVESDWSIPSSPTFVETRALSNGAYTFYVRTRDDFGNVDPTPAKKTFMVDITPPTVTLTSPKADGIVAGKVAIVGSAFDTSPIQDFQRYRLRYGTGIEPGQVADWDTVRILNVKSKEIRDDTLAIWDTDGLPNGSYVLQLSAHDKLGHESHDFVKVQVVRVSQPVDSRRGSQFSAADNLEIYIPPNAIQQDLRLNVRDWPIQEILPKAGPQVTFANLCFKIELPPDNAEMAKPATLTLRYPDSLLTNKNERKLTLYYSANGKGNWKRLGGSVDIENNKITTIFKQFGVFALYEDLSTGNKAGILNVTSQPRVFSPQGGGFNTQTAISFELGKESNVTIKIYNAAGRLVRVLTENEPMAYGTQVKYWDGKDQSGHYCLSGLHLVTIQAENKMVTKTVVVLNK